jgi:hypothetical protein
MTIQSAIALSIDIRSAVQSLVTALAGSPATLQLVQDITTQSEALTTGLSQLGIDIGAGLYPNTFVRNGVYLIVNNLVEQEAAVAQGYVVATFPETMIKAGSPDLVVNNEREKDEALAQGYTLPGLV